MANVLEFLFKGRCKPDHVVSWIQMETQQTDVPEVLLSFQNERREFIPYLLNYLRGQTSHLLQKSKSASPSPVKWKQKAKPQISTPNPTVRTLSCKRVQLFPDDTSQSKPFTNFAEEFPQLQIEPLSKKFTNTPQGMVSNKLHPSATHKNDENALNRRFKKSTKIICLSDFLINDSKNTWSNNDNSNNNNANSEQPFSLSFKLVNKKRRKPSPPEVKQMKEKPLHFLDNRHNVIPSNDQQKTQAQMKPSRRIKPTPVQAGMERKQNEAFKQMPEIKPEKNVFAKNQENLQSNISASMKERELLSLRMEGCQILFSPNNWNVSPSKHCFYSNKQPSTDVKDSVEVNLNFVTHLEELHILTELYSECLHASLFPNLTVEIFFLVQLLVVRCTKEDIDETDCIGHDFLRSIHNVVYFSLKVLEKLLWLLPSLGPTVLKLLSDNPRVESFSPVLKQCLCKIQENKDSSTQLSPLLPRSSIGGVSFQAETDNRNNFPTPKSFSMFRAQRDSFYELIREWKDNHEKPQWTFRGALEKKIHLTFSPDMELANYWHLAKLFISQLIMMYKEDNCVALHDDDDSISFISQLKKSNPEKYKRLQERFIIPLSTNGPSPPPSFTGSQEFFHDFILSANNHVFNQHISDLLKAKILELDKYQFVSLQSVNEDNGNASSDIKRELKSCLLTLRLLAKFLGFLTFLPYQSINSLPEEVHPAYLEIRNNSSPPCDILVYLKQASIKGRLCYTIPWVVEFLSWMDSMSPWLDYYQRVFQKLFSIHRQSWADLRSGFCVKTWLFIIVQIEWLFGIPNIPDGTFFNLMNVEFEPREVPSECLDNTDLVDQSILYLCCPYLGSIKSLLLEFASGSSTKASTLRKITPVAADDSPKLSTARQLQLQLEDNFFHNHPASLKRTAEFVAERTASNFIKQFRNITLVKLLQNGCDKISRFSVKNANEPNLKELQLNAIETYAKEFMSDVQKFLSNELKSYVQTNSKKVIDVFVPGQSEVLKIVIIGIIVHLAEERVQQWMMAKITKGIFIKEMNRELTKLSKPSKVISEVSLPSYHDTNSSSPSQVLIELKTILRQILLQECLPNIEKLKMLFDKANKMLSGRQDKCIKSVKSLKDFVCHLAIQIIINYPRMWTSIEDNYLSLWNKHLQDEKPDITFSKDKLDKLILKSPEKQLSQMHLESLSLKIDS